MKKFNKIILVVIALLFILAGCGSSKSTSKTESSETTQNSQETATESVSFFADGEYEVGTDAKPGSYFVVLTEFQPKDNYDHIYFKYGANLDYLDDNHDYKDEDLKIIGKPYKITFKEGMKFSFGSDSSSSWNVSFFTADDYKEYQSSEKK